MSVQGTGNGEMHPGAGHPDRALGNGAVARAEPRAPLPWTGGRRLAGSEHFLFLGLLGRCSEVLRVLCLSVGRAGSEEFSQSSRRRCVRTRVAPCTIRKRGIAL